MVALHPVLGRQSAAVGLLPVLAGAIGFGLWGGIGSATLQFLLTCAVMEWGVTPAVPFDSTAILGTGLWIVMGAAVGNQRDLTLRLRAELRRNEQLRVRERETLQAIPDTMIRSTPDGACQLGGETEPTSLSAALARAIGESPSDEQVAALARDIARARTTGEPQTGSLELHGGTFHDVRSLPSTDGSVLVVMRDATQQRRLHRRLASTENLASLGTLAAGLAHEINNPLTYVITSVNAIGESAASQNPTIAAEVDAALEGAWRIRDLVHSILEATNDHSESVKPVSVADVLDTVRTLVDARVRERATLTCESDGAPLVMSHHARLVQVVVSLVVNACQSFDARSRESNSIVVRGTEVGNQVLIRVRDNGPGMDETTQLRAVEPFYTTREPGAGSGLGLFLCNSIVESLGGSLEIDSGVGSGTTVTLRLPTAGSAASPASSRTRREQAMATHGLPRCRVLIVDDEPEIRRALRRQLGRTHAISMSSNGREALQRFAMGERFDVVLCDLLMPEVNGMELFHELEQQYPEQADRVIFITGGATSEAAQAFVENHRDRVIGKPFTPVAIEAAMRGVVRFSSVPPPPRQALSAG